jgi:hypothetical protein
MPSQNEAATNLKVSTIIKQAGKLLYNQVANSLLSKQGKTTLTGIFEAIPQNAVVSKRGFTTPGSGTPTTTIDRVAGTQANTYLNSLKNRNKI